MKKYFCLIFCFFIHFSSFAYDGEEEVKATFSKISNITNPTLEDYKILENFLQFGQRLYLAPIGLNANKRNGRELKLIGDNGEMPFHKIYHLNTSRHSRERCIILYSSYNYPYPGKLKVLVSELKKCGYRGHLIVRIGGYPNLADGGLHLCHIPYSWKLASLQEARNLGYRYILWLDSAIHPLCNLDRVFAMIEKDHYLCTSAGFNLDYPANLGHHLPNAIAALQVSDLLPFIPHVSSQIIGLDTHYAPANRLLDEWFKETLKVEPCMNWYPEELCYSVAVWRSQISPNIVFGNIVFTKDNYNKVNRDLCPFYWDQNRENDPQWDPHFLD